MFTEYSARFITKTYLQLLQSWSPIREVVKSPNSLSLGLEKYSSTFPFPIAIVKGKFSNKKTPTIFATDVFNEHFN